MKKLLVFITGMVLFLQHGQAQPTRVTWLEDFDGSLPPTGWTAQPSSGAWMPNTMFYTSSSSLNPQSYLGLVPSKAGSSIVLTTDYYDFTNYPYVFLRFKHICKVSPDDKVQIEYKEANSANWAPIPANTYNGDAANYASSGFNAASYPEWQAGNISAMPNNLWWKEELFDLWYQVGSSVVQFRFVITRGNVAGTQLSYGWLLEDLEIMAATHQIDPPTVQFVAPLVKDTVYSTGPWEINAEVRTNTNAPIVQPWLKWDTNGVFADSVLMTHVSGNAFWKANIPQYPAGTIVSYYITGRDTSGNTATATSFYEIVRMDGGGQTGYVIIGTGTLTNYYTPMNLYYQNSWTRQIYLASEFDAASSGGMITHLAWDYNYTQPFSVNNQRCYFKAVPASVTTCVQGYVDPVVDGATLVWQGVYSSSAGRTWAEIALTTPFMLPPGQNLMVYWIHEHGPGYPGSAYVFNHTTMATNMSVYAQQDAGGLPIGSAGTLTTARANARFYLIGGSNLDHSAAMHSIDMDDTVATSSTAITPIVVTVKNKGRLNLDSVTVSYSINGGAVKDTLLKFNPSLYWDFVHQDTIGYYTPSMNKYDTVVVWVSYPNGAYDSTTYDDTLTKMIYGSSDLYMEFVASPNDTVYDVGPFNIAAIVKSLTGNTVISNVDLYVKTVRGLASPILDTLPMAWDAAAEMWRAVLPQLSFGSDVSYKISQTDYLGNIVELENTFYIRYIVGNGYTGYDTVGTGSSGDYRLPLDMGNNYSWTRQLYLASELNTAASGGWITHLAWDYNYGLPFSMANQKCYFKAVDDAVITNTAYQNPVADGATLVWQGGYASGTGRVWAELELINPFTLPPGKNLLIYWQHEAGNPATNNVQHIFNYTSTSPNYMAISATSASSLPVSSAGALTYNRPNARFYIVSLTVADVPSVSVQSIESPPTGTPVNTPIPVVVTLRNEGMNNLNSCEIYWTKNGVLQPTTFPGSPTYTFASPLPAKYTITDTIGYYTNTGGTDTIMVWVEMPDGYPDIITQDDTLTRIVSDCPSGTFSGTYAVGPSSALYPTIASALSYLKSCGLSGKVTFLLEDGVYNETVDLSGIPTSATDTFELAPLNSGGATIETTGTGILFGESDNIIVRDLTVSMSGNAQGIVLGTGSNIEINGCRIYLDSSSSVMSGYGTGHVALTKPQVVSKRSDNVRILNNYISGGYNPVNLQGGTGMGNCADWIFDGNTIRNGYYHHAYIYEIDLLSFSNNTSIQTATNAASGWRGFTLQGGDVLLMKENKVLQVDHPNSNPTGIIFSMKVPVAGNPVVVAEVHNNEIILSKTGTGPSNPPSSGESTCAFAFYNGSANIYHNSIYVQEVYQATYYRILEIETDEVVNVKNNNIVTALSRPIAFWGNAVVLDYNNYYTGGTNFGYLQGTSVTPDLAAWQTASGQDANSISILPDYIDTTTSLKLNTAVGLLCPGLPSVTNDIEGKTRGAFATMGCYEMFVPVSLNAGLVELVTVNPTAVIGQTDTVKVIVSNSGLSTAINSISLAWSVNGGPMQTLPPYAVSLPGGTGQSTVLTLGTINYTVANEDIKVWITDVNGSGIDGYQDDDTISKTISVSSDIIAEFVVNPTDTVYSTGVYEVTAKIQFLSTTPPLSIPLYIEYIEHEGSNTTIYDTLHLLPQGNDLWTTEIYNIRYESDVAYRIELIDLFNNNIVLADAYYIQRPECIDDRESGGTSAFPITDYAYTGSAVPVLLPRGTYLLETWGGDGGLYSTSAVASKGGYSVGEIKLTQPTTLYVVVGGYSSVVGANQAATYNGGGACGNFGGPGGGATHIATATGVLSSLSSNQSSVLIVAGGGGGSGFSATIGGNGGGLTGAAGGIGSGSVAAGGGTQSAGGVGGVSTGNGGDAGTFGQGGTTTGAGGGGGGWYGGGRGANGGTDGGGGGGSGYIGGVTNGVTAQLTQPDFVPNPVSTGYGYARITPLGGGDVRLCLDNSVAMEDIITPRKEEFAAVPVPVKVRIRNKGELKLDSCYIDWTLDGNLQNHVLYTHPTGLLPDFTDTMTIGDCPPAAGGQYEVVAWVSLPNGEVDSVTWDDTLSTEYIAVPLAEFVEPFVVDTIYTLSFDVNTHIFEGTGATVTVPKMYIQTIMDNCHFYDTITMVKDSGNWVANIPPQYYNSKIIYELHLTDTLTPPNSIVLMDSTFIKLEDGNGIGVMGTLPTPPGSGSAFAGFFFDLIADAKPVTITTINAQLTAGSQTVHVYYRPTTANGNCTSSAGWTLVSTQTVTGLGIGSFVPLNLSTLVTIPAGQTHGFYVVTTSTVSYSGGGTTAFVTTLAADSYLTITEGASATGVSPTGTVFPTSISAPRQFVGAIDYMIKGLDVYPGNHLTLTEFVSPVNDPNELCELAYAPVKVALTNIGENDYDFSIDNIILYCEIIDPQQVMTIDSIIINTGGLESGETDTVEIVPPIPLLTGTYAIKAWVSSSIDNFPCDDTITSIYLSGKIGLPIDEDFSGSDMPHEFISIHNNWTVYHPILGDPVQPDFGTGVVMYSGTSGSDTLTTRQLDLYGAVSPELHFWYYHDNTTSSDADYSYTNVTIRADGIDTTALTVYRVDAVNGWKEYMVDLGSFTNAQCVLIQFDAMNKNFAGQSVAQYIDRIVITSVQDLALTELIIDPPLTDCDMQNKDIYVVLRTSTNQGIDISVTPTGITLENAGQWIATQPLQQNIAGNSSDTILVASGFNFAKGVYGLKAYLTDPVDVTPFNDTIDVPLNINPALFVDVQALSSTGNCLFKETDIYQQITVNNTGNLPLSTVVIMFEITDAQGTPLDTKYDTIQGTIPVGGSEIVNILYKIPAIRYYFADATAYLLCDPSISHKNSSGRECVNIDDIELLSLVEPQGAAETWEEEYEVAVRLRNLSDIELYDVILTAQIEGTNNELITSLPGVLVGFYPGTDSVYTFPVTYTAPKLTDYVIRVFINKLDDYQYNDTLRSLRTGQDKDNITDGLSNKFALEQNIPNPAKNGTLIEYSIPASGELVFNVHTVSGQLLHSQTLQSASGKHVIELNTTGFAAGVYFYSIEYQGQKLVRRMSVKN